MRRMLNMRMVLKTVLRLRKFGWATERRCDGFGVQGVGGGAWIYVDEHVFRDACHRGVCV